MSKLIIKFRCLCFFVHDRATGQAHVVTPATCCGGDQHASFLIFPREDGRLNSFALFKGKNAKGTHDFVVMDDFSMVLPGNGTSASSRFSRSVFNLNRVTGGSVPRAIVAGPRDPRITSRITLPSGHMSNPVTPGLWDFADQRLRLARDVLWTIDGLPDGPLELRRSRFQMGRAPNPLDEERIEIIQPNENGEFRLQFHSTLPGDFGKTLQPRDPDVAARHFEAYYGLYEQPAKTPVPKFVNEQQVGVVGCIPSGGQTS